jgi:hypothetical protein
MSEPEKIDALIQEIDMVILEIKVMKAELGYAEDDLLYQYALRCATSQRERALELKRMVSE